jgi:hypothetical protein
MPSSGSAPHLGLIDHGRNRYSARRLLGPNTADEIRRLGPKIPQDGHARLTHGIGSVSVQTSEPRNLEKWAFLFEQRWSGAGGRVGRSRRGVESESPQSV